MASFQCILHKDFLLHIFSHLPLASLSRCSAVCREWHHIIDHSIPGMDLWLWLYMRYHNVQIPPRQVLDPTFVAHRYYTDWQLQKAAKAAVADSAERYTFDEKDSVVSVSARAVLHQLRDGDRRLQRQQQQQQQTVESQDEDGDEISLDQKYLSFVLLRDTHERLYGRSGVLCAANSGVVESNYWRECMRVNSGVLRRTTVIATLEDNRDEVWQMRWSHCGTLLATVSKDGRLYMWALRGLTGDSETGETDGPPQVVKVFEIHVANNTSIGWVDFSVHGKYMLLSLASDNMPHAFLFDLETNERHALPVNQPYDCYANFYHRNGEFLLHGGSFSWYGQDEYTQSLSIVHCATRIVVARIIVHIPNDGKTGCVHHATLSHDGRFIVFVTGEDGDICNQVGFIDLPESVHDTMNNPDSVAAREQFSTTDIINVRVKITELRRLNVGGFNLGFVLSADDRHLYTIARPTTRIPQLAQNQQDDDDDDGELGEQTRTDEISDTEIVQDSNEGEEAEPGDNGSDSSSVSSGQRYLSQKVEIQVWDTKHHTMLTKMFGPIGFSPLERPFCIWPSISRSVSGEMLTIGSEDGGIHLYTTEHLHHIGILNSHTALVNAASWNPQYPQILASVSDDTKVKIWMTEK